MTARRPALAVAFAVYAAVMAWITVIVAVPLMVALPALEPGMSTREWVAVSALVGVASAIGPVLYGGVAWALHRGTRWADNAATALAVLSLGSLPLGAALGVGTLWHLHGGARA